MTIKRLALFLLVLLALLGASAYYNDWFHSDHIQIVHSIRPQLQGRRSRSHSANENLPGYTLAFGLRSKLKLSELKVIPLSDLATNKYAHPIWHLISDSNSVPTKVFSYGERIPGMKPSVAGATADPLEPGAKYRLFLQAGEIKGEHDFDVPANLAPK